MAYQLDPIRPLFDRSVAMGSSCFEYCTKNRRKFPSPLHCPPMALVVGQMLFSRYACTPPLSSRILERLSMPKV